MCFCARLQAARRCHVRRHPRLFCPHVLGKSKQGRRHAFCYQFGGTSDSGLRTVAAGVGGWRGIVVEKLSEVELQSGIWHSEPRSIRQTSLRRLSSTPTLSAAKIHSKDNAAIAGLASAPS